MRLTQEYQLIEHYDEQVSAFKKDKLDAYIALIGNSNITNNNNNNFNNIKNKTTDSKKYYPVNDKTTTTAIAVTEAAAAASTTTSILQRYGFNRNSTSATSVTASTTTSTSASSSSSDVFVLSMGHRIQFLQFSSTGVSILFYILLKYYISIYDGDD